MLCVDTCSKQIIRICRQSQLHPLKSKKDIAMEMPVDRDDFNFEVFETDDQNPIPKSKRLCPQCNGAVFGRRNKIFCTSNCRKRHSEPTRNSYSSPTKRRENSEFFDRALRLAVELYALPPNQRLGFMKDLIDYARLGEDPQLRDILSNYVLLHPHPYNDLHLFPRRSRAYCTIAQAASNYCKRFWRANVRDVVYGRAPEPPTGEVE